MEPDKKSSGVSVGLIVIIIILVIGGIYVWQTNKVSNEAAMQKLNEAQNQSDTVTTQDSTDLNSLEQDLNTADTDIGVDINTIE